MFSADGIGLGYREHPRDKMINASRRDEEHRRRMQEQVSYYSRSDLRSEFEKRSSHHAICSEARRAADILRNNDAALLEERSDRMRALFDQDSAYWQEAIRNLDTKLHTVDRVAEMTTKLAILKAKREEERQILVAEKLEMQRRLNSDELRTAETKARAKSVSGVLDLQVAQNVRKKQSIAQEDQFYDNIFEQTRQEQVQVLKSEQLERAKVNKIFAEFVLKQQQDNLKAVAEQKRLERLEANYIEQKVKLLEIQENQNRINSAAQMNADMVEQMKINKQIIEDHRRNAANEMDESIKWINELQKMEENDKMKQKQKRDALRSDLQMFAAYIVKQRGKDKLLQKEIDEIYNMDSRRELQKVAQNAKKESDARRLLMRQVILIRQQQVEDNLNRVRTLIESKKKEQVHMEALMTEYMKINAENSDLARKRAAEYKQELIQQIYQNNQKALRDKKKDEEIIKEQECDFNNHNHWLQVELSKLDY